MQPLATITKQVSSPALVVPPPAPLSSTNVLPLSPPKPFPVAPFTATNPIKTTISTIAKVNSHHSHHTTHTHSKKKKSSLSATRQKSNPLSLFTKHHHHKNFKFIEKKAEKITSPKPPQQSIDHVKLLEHVFFSQTFKHFIHTQTLYHKYLDFFVPFSVLPRCYVWSSPESREVQFSEPVFI